MKKLRSFIPVILLGVICFQLEGCVGFPSRVVDIVLTISPKTVYINETIDIKVTLHEPSGVEVNLNYIKGEVRSELGILLFQEERTGEEAQETFCELFGTNQLTAYGTLYRTFYNVHIPDPGLEVERKAVAIVTMGGIDDNGDSVSGSDRCSLIKEISLLSK